MGAAYLIVDLVSKTRIRPLHGNASRLPQGHGPGLEAGCPRAFGIPQPAALLLGYPINDFYEVKPLYHAADKAALPLPSER